MFFLFFRINHVFRQTRWTVAADVASSAELQAAADDDDDEGVSDSGSSRLRGRGVALHPLQSGLRCVPALRDNGSVWFWLSEAEPRWVGSDSSVVLGPVNEGGVSAGCGSLLVLDQTDTGVALVRR